MAQVNIKDGDHKKMKQLSIDTDESLVKLYGGAVRWFVKKSLIEIKQLLKEDEDRAQNR